MNGKLNIYRLVRSIFVGLLLVGVTGCAAGSNESDELVTSSGFVCPQPNPRVEFESKEINIFTWTE